MPIDLAGENAGLWHSGESVRHSDRCSLLRRQPLVLSATATGERVRQLDVGPICAVAFSPAQRPWHLPEGLQANLWAKYH
jgi:hypothetical protein